ncbi:hypothetical protein BVRB_5g099820 [Beta vulgaris subsp. vulgaris]|nr:hypothetical protein BVRB_5g099820 [Beta vulgaris subsp. vulgaris]
MLSIFMMGWTFCNAKTNSLGNMFVLTLRLGSISVFWRYDRILL